jgi:hypothetical protein
MSKAKRFFVMSTLISIAGAMSALGTLVFITASGAAETTTQTYTLQDIASRYKEIGKTAIASPTPFVRPARIPSADEINITFDHFVPRKAPAKSTPAKGRGTPQRTPRSTAEPTLADFGVTLPGPIGQKPIDPPPQKTPIPGP